MCVRQAKEAAGGRVSTKGTLCTGSSSQRNGLCLLWKEGTLMEMPVVLIVVSVQEQRVEDDGGEQGQRRCQVLKTLLWFDLCCKIDVRPEC